jgi:NAD(P)-dependent dehydrogenase (short-subunit alcohol dehydrogenase family)
MERASASPGMLAALARMFIEIDVRDEAQIESLVGRVAQDCGRLDVVVNNAGIERYLRPEEYTSGDWDAIVSTNLRAAFLIAKYAYPHLKQSRGSIVNIASVQAFANEPHLSVYAASKGGMLALTRAMALDYAAEGIRVNAVCPGAIRTGMMEAALAGQPDPEAAIQAIGRSIPLGRVGEPEDIARAVYFLASPSGDYITGASLVVDGGLLTRLAI